MSNNQNISLIESVRKTAQFEEEHDVCPKCGEEYVDTDTTLSGTVVVIHEENPIKECQLDDYD